MSEATPSQPSEQREAAPPAPAAAVARARADLEAGREWKARDRLSGLLAERYDAEALDMLGEVNYAMRDLPAAGAAWFGTRRRGEDVDAAIEAWRDRHSDHFAQMWRTLPPSVRQRQGNKRVDALRRRAEQGHGARGARVAGGASTKAGRVDAAVVIAVVIAAFLVVCTVVGFVVVLRWIVPGS